MLSAVFFGGDVVPTVFFIAMNTIVVFVAIILGLSNRVSIDTVADVALREQEEPEVSDALEVVNDPPEPSDKQDKQETLVIRYWDYASVPASSHVERSPKKRACPPQERLAAALFSQEQQMIWYLTMLLLLEEHGEEEELEYTMVDVEDYDDLNDQVVNHITRKPRGRRERGNQGLAKRARRLGIEAKRN